MTAVSHSNYPAIAAMLALGVDPRQTGATGQTVLHAAYMAESEAERLFDLFPDVDINAREQFGRTADGVPATPLHLAAELGNPDVVRALSRRGVDWEVGDRFGRTPLAKAVFENDPESVMALLEAGADPDAENTLGAFGDTPLSMAISIGSPLTDALLRHSDRWQPAVSYAVGHQEAGRLGISRSSRSWGEPISFWRLGLPCDTSPSLAGI